MRQLLWVVVLVVGCGGGELAKKPDASGAAGEAQEAGTGAAGSRGEAGAGAAGQSPTTITMRLVLQNCDSRVASFAAVGADGINVMPRTMVPPGSCTTTCRDDPSTGASCNASVKMPLTTAGYCDAFTGSVLYQDCLCSGTGERGQTLATFQCVQHESLALGVAFADGKTDGLLIECVPNDIASARCPL